MGRSAGLLAMIEVVVVLHRESDMASSDNDDPLAIATLVEVQGSGALVIRCLQGSNLQAKSGSEGTAYVGGGKVGGDVIEQLWASGLGVDSLPEGDLDIGNVSVAENVLAAVGRCLGILVGQSPRKDANPEMERTGFPSLLGESDRVDGSPLHGTGIEVLIDSNAQLVPHFLNWVAANWPGLPQYALLLGALAHRPLGAGFEDAEGVRR